MLLGFKRRFAPFVKDGSKRHTIRGLRKNPPKVGETCHCYVDPRQKTMALLGRWRCVKVEDIVITERQNVLVDAVLLSESECNELAWSDGFRDGPKDEAFFRMMQFWDGRLPFVGNIIHWHYEPARDNETSRVRERAARTRNHPPARYRRAGAARTASSKQ